MKAKCSTLVLVLAAFGGRVAAEESTTRPLLFPSSRNMGVLYVREPGKHEETFEGWERWADACGAVTVPADCEVRLDVGAAACADLSPLRQLRADDLQVLTFRGTDLDEEALECLGHLTSLEVLMLFDCQVSDRGLRHIAGLSSLRELNLRSSSVSDEGAAHLSKLPSLSALFLSHSKVTEKGVGHLVKMRSLETLELYGNEIGDAGVERLRELKSLRRLGIGSDHYLSDDGLRHLTDLENLEWLDLSNTSIGDQALARLKNLPRLQYLRLTDTNVSDGGLAHLRDFRSLQDLLLPAGISDRGLEHVSKVGTLRSLLVQHSPITDAGVSALERLAFLETLQICCAPVEKDTPGVTDKSAASLVRMAGLKVLWLQLSGITDHGLAQLTGLKSLETLQLAGNQITWEGLRHLRRFPALTDLTVTGIRGEDLTLRHLAALTGLKRLAINGSGRFDSDAELTHLAGLTRLEELSISGIPIEDEGLEHLAELTSLRNLRLYDRDLIRVGDAGLRHLKDMRKLQVLQITGPITDHGLDHLRPLKSLQYLTMGTHMLSESSIEDLKREIPWLQYVRKNEPRRSPKELRVGQAAPEFKIETLGGETLRLKDLRGKAVVLYFWATWCSPCVKATPEVKALQERSSRQYGDFIMISLSLDEEEHYSRRHAERHGLTWPQAWIGWDSELQSEYGVKGAPSYVVIDPNGIVSFLGSRSEGLEDAIASALRDD